MNVERLLDALGNIDERFLVENTQAEWMPPRKDPKRRKLPLFAGLAAVLLAIALIFLLRPAPSRLTLTVYAMNAQGDLVEHPLAENQSLPVSLITADDGTAGFLFSVSSVRQLSKFANARSLIKSFLPGTKSIWLTCFIKSEIIPESLPVIMVSKFAQYIKTPCVTVMFTGKTLTINYMIILNKVE